MSADCLLGAISETCALPNRDPFRKPDHAPSGRKRMRPVSYPAPPPASIAAASMPGHSVARILSDQWEVSRMPIFLDRHDVVEFSAEEVAKLHVKGPRKSRINMARSS